jgi:exopolyphosphatase/guanosine-5'-triphosphate,3'-diphosphate pyrophosphatase
VLTRESVVDMLNQLAGLPLDDRRRVRGLAPARAPVIVAGLVVLDAILARYALGEITVSERDLLHGVALEAAKLPEPEEGPTPPGAYTCC